MQITGDKYQVIFNPEKDTVICSGFLDLRGKEGYNDIALLFDHVANRIPTSETIILDMKELEFLNSSGITTLAGFIIKLRKKEKIKLQVKCSIKYSWQGRSMIGLEKLMPDGMEFIFE